MMPLNMTAQLAPVLWVLVAMLLVSLAGILHDHSH
jgi:hypothetical protein